MTAAVRQRLYTGGSRDEGGRRGPPRREDTAHGDDDALVPRATGKPYHVKRDEAREGLTAAAASRMWPLRGKDHSVAARAVRPQARPSSAPPERTHGPAHALVWEPSCEEIRQSRPQSAAARQDGQREPRTQHQQQRRRQRARQQQMSAHAAVAEALRVPSEALARSLARDPLTRSARVYKLAIAEHRPSTAQSIHEAKLTAPGVPFITLVEPLTVDTVRVTWRQPLSDGGVPLSGFRLQFREVSALAKTPAIICSSPSPADLPSWAKADDPSRALAGGGDESGNGDSEELRVPVGPLSTSSVHGGDVRQVELTHLRPAGSYAVRLCAGNDIGFGRWTVFEGFDLPTKLALRVERSRSAQDGLLVHWALPARSTPVAFELQFKPEDQASTPEDEHDSTKTLVVKAASSRLKTEQQEAAVRNLVAATKGGARRGRHKKARRGKLRKTKPRPAKLEKTSQPPAEKSPESGAAEHEMMLVGLEKHSYYSLRMREVYADEHVGRWTAPVRARTLPPPPRAPTITSCDVTSKTIMVRWEAAEEDEACRYSLHCVSTDSGSVSTVNIDRAEMVDKHGTDATSGTRGWPRVHRCVVDRLSPGVEYALRIVAQHVGGSTPSQVASATTEPHEAVPRVRQVVARSDDTNDCATLSVSWQLEGPLGPMLGDGSTVFQIEYRRQDTEEPDGTVELQWHRSVFPAEIPPNGPSYTQVAAISEAITPSTFYAVRVRAMCSLGAGHWRQAEGRVQTELSRPQHVTVDPKATSISVAWKLPAIYGDGSDLQYEVQASTIGENGEIGPVIKRASAFAACACEVQGLDPAQRYAIRVRAQCEDEVSKLSDVCVTRTAAAVIHECSESLEFSADLTWRLEPSIATLVRGWTVQFRVRDHPNAMPSVADDVYVTGSSPALLRDIHEVERSSPEDAVPHKAQNDDYTASFSGDSSRRRGRQHAKKSPGKRSPGKRASTPVSVAKVTSLQLDGSTRSTNLTNLTPGKPYSWRVIAHDERDKHFASPWETFFTKAAAPLAPIVLRSKITDTAIVAFFSTPQDMGSPVEGFEADLEKFGGVHEVQQLPPEADHCSFTDLEPGVNYTLRLRAQNAHGWCTSSNAVKLTTSRFTQVPDAPQINSSDIRGTSLTVKLTMSESSVPVKHFQVEHRELEGFRGWSIQKANGTEVRLQQMTPGTRMEVRACAWNDSGQSEYSAIHEVCTDSGVPAPPRNLSVSSVGVEDATLAWDAADPHGESIRQYRITFWPVGVPLERQEKSMDVSECTGDKVSASLAHLEPATQYCVNVCAVNSVGASTASGKLLFWTLKNEVATLNEITDTHEDADYELLDEADDVSRTPTIELVDEGIREQSVDLSWNALAEHPTAQYVVEMALDAPSDHIERLEHSGGTASRLNRVVGVLGGIQLENDGGEADSELILNANTLLVDEIEMALGEDLVDGTKMWMPMETIDGAGTAVLRCTVTDLSEDAWHQFRVRCEDAQGDVLACSAAITRRTNKSRAESSLATVGGLTLECDDTSAVGCSWSVDASGAPVKRYEVRYRSVSGRSKVPGPWQHHFTDLRALEVSGFDPGSRVEVSVRAWSEDAVGPWTKAKAICTNFTVPSPPQLVTRQIQAHATVVSVVWRAPPKDGGRDVERYEVRCRRVEHGAVPVLASHQVKGDAVQSTTVTGLQPQSQYEIHVRGANAVGWSEWSRVAEVVTPLPTVVADIHKELSIEPSSGPWELYRLLFAEVVDKAAGESLERNYQVAYGEPLAEAVRAAQFDHWLIFRQLLPSSAQPPQLAVAADAGNDTGQTGTTAAAATAAAAALRDAILWADRAAVVSLVLPAPGDENTRVAMSSLAHAYYSAYGYTIAEHLNGRFSTPRSAEDPAVQLFDGDSPDGPGAFGLVVALEYALHSATADEPALGMNGAADQLVRDLERLLVDGVAEASDSKPAIAAILRRVQQLTPAQRRSAATLYEKRHARALRDIGGGSPSAEVMAWGAFRGCFNLLLDDADPSPAAASALSIGNEASPERAGRGAAVPKLRRAGQAAVAAKRIDDARKGQRSSVTAKEVEATTARLLSMQQKFASAGNDSTPAEDEGYANDIAWRLVQLLRSAAASHDLVSSPTSKRSKLLSRSQDLGQPQAEQAVEQISALLLGLSPSLVGTVAAAYAAASGGANLQRDIASNFLLEGKGLLYLLRPLA